MTTHLYTDLAPWWPLLSCPADYEEEAGIYTRVILEVLPEARSMLELGSGGGNNASFLKQRFAIILVDLSPGMLAVSRRLNPELEHIQGDMRSVRLGRSFDVVFIHDAIMYMTSEDDLRAAIQTAYAHTRPGGLALFAPDCTRETFRPGTDHGGHDGAELTPPQPGRALRYLEWTYDPDPADTHYTVDFAYLLRQDLLRRGEDSIQVIHDRHIFGLFSRATWLRLMREAGFEPSALPFAHSELEQVTEMFVGVRGIVD